MRSLLLLAIGVAACRPAPPPDDVFVDPRTARVELDVRPARIDFGAHEVDEPQTATIELINGGIRDARIDDVRITGSVDFTLLTDLSVPFVLPSEKSIELEVGYTPLTDGVVTGRVEIESTAHDPAVVPVPLEAEGLVPILTFTPPGIALGDDGVGCEETATLVLGNTGSAPLVLDDVQLLGLPGAVRLRGEALTVAELAPGARTSLTVTYGRETASIVDHDVLVLSNDPSGPATAPITGTASWGDREVESFRVPERRPVNVMLVVDQSVSMSGAHYTIRSALPAFVDIMQAATPDWKVGVVTGWPVCFIGGDWVEADTPDFLGYLRGAVSASSQGLGESLLEATARALEADEPGGCNEGFLEEGTQLHVVIFSDERDQSIGWRSDDTYWRPLLERIRERAHHRIPVTIHAIVDQYYRSGCGGPSDGPRGYAEAVQATGGHLADICRSGWTSAFLDIASEVVEELVAFEVSGRGFDPDSVVVEVDGEVWEDGWVFDPEGHTLRLTDPVDAGALVQLSYGTTVCAP